MVEHNYATAVDIARFMAVSAFVDEKLAQVDLLIELAEDDIDSKMNHAWREVEQVYEEHEANYDYEYTLGRPIFLNRRKVRSVSAVEYLSADGWVTWGSEGSDYIVDYTLGEIYLKGLWSVIWRNRRIRVTYKYGDTVVPGYIRKLCILMVCIDLVSNENKYWIIPEGGDKIDLKGKVDIWQKQIDRIISERSEISILDW